MDFISSWLYENQPLEVGSSIVHNDFKYDNLVLDKDDFSKINAVLDWEMATIGDPFMDLGTTLGYWVDKNDLPELKLFQLSATTLDGNPTREGILELYEKESGKSISNPVFYYVFGLFKIAVIAQQIYFRYKKGFTKDKRFKLLNLAVISLSIMAKQAIDKNRLSDLFE
jgi:aminoglycoside phosphotransferase (APT) family kinase protein